MTPTPASPTSRLDRVFRPESATVVGASTEPMSIGGRVYANLQFDFPGRLYPVNARAPEVQGDRAYASVDLLPEPVDLVVVMTPTPSVPGIIRSCIERGDGGAYIITAGFSESGPEGAALQDDIRTMSLEHDFPVFGPNCIGFTSTHRHITATFALFPERGRPTPGPVGIVSQSGGFGSFILNRAVDRGIHVGMFASTGNECDVDFASVLEYCVEDPELETIAVFAETIRQPDAFLRAVARAQELGKQIISVSPVVSEAVARAVMSHTASIVGSAEVYASVCQQYGVVQADSIESMLDYCRLLQERKPMKGRRIGVVTQSGGAGVLVASNATDEGFDLPELGPETQEYLKTLLPPDASAKNPIDTTAGTMAPDAYGKILQRLVDDDLIDGVIPIIWAGFNQQQVEQVADVYYGQEKPMAPVVAMEPGPLTALGVPVYDDPTRAVRALGVVARANEPMAWTSPSSFEPDAARASAVADLLAPVRAKPFVLESTAKEALAAYGIAVAAERVCAGEDEAVAAFEAIGGNVVLKVLSYDLPHKSDSGGLVLDLDSADAVRHAYRDLLHRFEGQPSTRIEGVLVQEMVGARIELALGLERDPVFGPMVAIGLGGVLIEIISRPQLLHAPFGIAEARLAVSRVADGRIGHAARGLDEAQQEAFAQGAVALGELALEHPSVLSVDVNPLLPTPGGMKAVDALLVLDGA